MGDMRSGRNGVSDDWIADFQAMIFRARIEPGLPLSGAGPCQFLKKPCQFPGNNPSKITFFTSENRFVNDHVNLGLFWRADLKRDRTMVSRIGKNGGFPEARIPGWMRQAHSVGCANWGGGLRSVLWQDFFCRIRGIFYPWFLLEHKTGPFTIMQAGTGPETCLFIPLWAAEAGSRGAFGRGVC